MVVEKVRVGGIPVFVAESPSPHRVSLVFRVGAGDEPLALRGLSHLVEHLALADLRDVEHLYNGFVTWNTTQFVAQGTPDDLRRYIERVSAGLSSLPLDRLETERGVLLAEEAGRSHSSALETLLMWRFGARGYGTVGYHEHGLRSATAERVAGWASEFFVDGNAAVWCAGPDAAALVSMLEVALPAGPRAPAPVIADAIDLLPAWAKLDIAGPNVSIVAPRSAPLSTMVAIGHQRIEDEARHERGIAYVAGGSYEPLDADTAHAHLGVDGRPENHAELAEILFATISAIVDHGPTDEELARYKRRWEASKQDPHYGLSVAQRQAVEHLLGRDESIDEVEAAIDAVDTAAVAAALEAAMPSALALVPPGCEVPATFSEVPQWSARAVVGADFTPRSPERAWQKMTIGNRGVTWHAAERQVLTVPVDACQALLRWDDGTRVLIADEGIHIHVAPWDWKRGTELVAAIDRLYPESVAVPMGPSSAPPVAHGIGSALRLFWRRYQLHIFIVILGLAAVVAIATGAWGGLIGGLVAWFVTSRRSRKRSDGTGG